ncbi:MAG TPA: type II toxin-antitoxin system PemK/MazF family toxin [Gemmatimonadales bacterium]|nr:type II toxin-antitoxin system PemK/MazF family toxin [Gemmatimonadales bacterium]
MIARGGICWLTADRPAGSRPVLVLQSEAFNRSRIPTVLVAPLAQDLRLGEAPGNVIVTRDASGLPRDAVIVVSQLAAVERVRLRGTGARLTDPVMALVDEGVKLVLGL